MKASQGLDGLDLHDDALSNEQVQPVAGLRGQILVGDRENDLASQSDAAPLKLIRETMLVDGLEQPRTQGTMDLQRCIHSHAGESLNLERNPFVSFASFVVFV